MESGFRRIDRFDVVSGFSRIDVVSALQADQEISLAFDLDDFERRYDELSRRALELRRHL